MFYHYTDTSFERQPGRVAVCALAKCTLQWHRARFEKYTAQLESNT